MPVLYNGYELRPVKTVTFDKQEQAFGDGRPINSFVRATVKGAIVPDKIGGVESPVADASKMSTILAKQKEIRDAFSVQGKTFEVQGWDGQAPAKFQARVASVTFPEGQWYNTSDYEVVLESAEFSGEADGNLYVESASENWSFEEDDFPKTTKVTHSVQAKGFLLYDATGAVPKLPWEYAKDFVTGQLGLGWATIGGNFSPTSGQQIAAETARNPATTAWNRVVSEEVNETEGTYSATETFLLSSSDYFEESTVGVRKVDDEPNLVVVVSLQGTVHGFYTNAGDYDTRNTNAQAAWATIKGLLPARAAAAAGVALNAHPTAWAVDTNPTQGTLTYQAEYNNRTLVNDTWETYEVSKKRSVEDYKTTVTVVGTIHGVSYLDTDSDPSVRFDRARSRWEAVKGLTYARAVSVSGLTDLKTFPVHAEVSEDTGQGTVSYSYDYDNRPYANVEVTYQVARRFSREDAKTTVTVEGTIQGLVTSGSDIFAAGTLSERFDNAYAYWQGMEPTLLGLAALSVDTTDQWLEAWSKSVTTDEFGGKVGFAYEFTSQIRCFPNALSESLTITNELSVPVIVEIPIPGKADGPVVQDLGTVSSNQQSLNIELVYPLPRVCGYYPPPVVNVDQYAPHGSLVWKTSDVPSWNWTQGRYSRNVTWKYKS